VASGENATQRGNHATAIAGSVAAAIFLIAREALKIIDGGEIPLPPTHINVTSGGEWRVASGG
jgi:hypothetical protein